MFTPLWPSQRGWKLWSLRETGGDFPSGACVESSMTTRRGRCSTRTQYGRNVEHAECRPRDTSYSFFSFPLSIHGNKKTWESLPGELSNYREELSNIVRWAYNWTIIIITRYPQFSVVAVTVNDEDSWYHGRGLSYGSMSRQNKINVQFLNDFERYKWYFIGTFFLSTFIALQIYTYIYISCSEWVWSICRGEAIWRMSLDEVSSMVCLC